MSAFPKILIISIDPFNRLDGSGITLTNIFEGWDKNSIAQVYFSDKTPSLDVCEKYFKLNSKTAFFDYYFRKLLGLFKSSQVASETSGTSIFTINSINSSSTSIKDTVHSNIKALLDFSPLFLPKELFKWLSEYNPDIIYSTLGSGRIIKLTNTIASTIQKPIVAHFMDDWITVMFTKNELAGLARKTLMKEMNNVFLKSNGGLCISDQMVEEYKRRYKLPFSTFVNCVKDSYFQSPTKNTKQEISIIYLGGLHLDRWKSILDISEVIEKLNEKGQKITLKIYCPVEQIKMFASNFDNFPATKFEGFIKSDQVPETLKNATVLLHVEAFDKNTIEYTRFSLSTKIPQYMASGKPILGYGPSILASMHHIIKSEAGIVVSEKELLFNAISQFLNNDRLFSYATKGYAYAKDKHTKSYNNIRLKSIIETYTKSEPIAEKSVVSM